MARGEPGDRGYGESYGGRPTTSAPQSSYWSRVNQQTNRVTYYYGPRGDAYNSQVLTQEEWDAYQNQYERDEEGRRIGGGGRPPPSPEEEGYEIPEADLSTFDQLERLPYVAGLWAEGIFKGLVLVIPPVILMAMAVGITMGLIRVGSRGMEKLFPTRRLDRCR